MYRQIVLIISLALWSCAEEDNQKTLDETFPVFSRIPLDVSESFDSENRIFDSLDCSDVSDDPFTKFCILVFGKDRLGGEKANVDHTFRTIEGAVIYAGLHGRVTRVEKQEEIDTDYAIFINPNPDMGSESISQYIVEFDHIIEPKVAVGDVVMPETEIGVSPYRDDIAMGRFEIQVSRYSVDGESAKQETVECPYNFFTDELKLLLDTALTEGHNVSFPENASEKMCYEESLPASAAQ